MNKIYITILFLLGINISSGKDITKFRKDRIKEIEFIYGQPDTDMPVAISCAWESFCFLGDFLLRKTRTDSAFIDTFATYFQELLPDPEVSYIDVRIMAVISYEIKETKDTLCFGEYHGIDLNGTFMHDNKGLLELVQQEVWWSENRDSVIYKLPFFQDWTLEEIKEFVKKQKE